MYVAKWRLGFEKDDIVAQLKKRYKKNKLNFTCLYKKKNGHVGFSGLLI
jgi:hypothetical protein